jgi:1,4-alpha-glucan branching enzyme
VKKKGYIAIVLHSHLPFVKYPEEEFFLEENWLYEAITETYLPLYLALAHLKESGIRFRITMSITPPLANMLEDELLISRYERYLKRRIALVEELLEKKNPEEVYDTLNFYRDKLILIFDTFMNKLNKSILSGFKKLQDGGFIEIITCSATHEILPLESNESVRNAQIKVGVLTYKRIFEKNPNGIWLGECAYTEGIDRILANNGIRFSILDTHGLLNGKPSPVYGVSAPIISKDGGVAFFGRDPEASKQVWSAQEGYPGDSNYREFYRDVAYDLTESEVKKFLHPAGFRFSSGIKLHKVTGRVPLYAKELYNRKKAEEMTAIHAGNFMFNREREAEYLLSLMDREPIMVAPFDTELFGHWWFEGPDFLENFFRKVFYESSIIEATTLSEYLEKYPVNQIISPSPSTWGDGGYFKVWLNEQTDWIYQHLNVLGIRMTNVANSFKPNNSLEKRVLNQMARELLLADSSDWAFLITVGTAVNYATSQEKFHINAFNKLYENLIRGNIDEDLLEYLEGHDSIFPFIDYTIFKNKEAV